MPYTLPVALQMYTLRDDAANDFAGTIRRVGAMGYAGVELAGYGGLAAADLKALLDEDNLVVAGSHVALGALEGGLDEVIADNTALGNKYVVCPYLPAERRRDAAGYAQVASAFNTAGARLREAGLHLAYHNHDFEFQNFDGMYGLDILFAASDPDLVKIELDTYWVKKAGVDPAAYLRKYPGRVPLIHLKDMTPGDNPTFAPVGEGIMDFGAIFDAAEAAGGEYYIVEQDVCQGPPLEAVRLSLDNLRLLGVAP